MNLPFYRLIQPLVKHVVKSAHLMLIIFFATFIAIDVKANDTNIDPLLTWTKYKHANNITIWYRKVDNSPLIEIKTQAVINSSLSGFLLFIQDTENASAWLDNVVESKVVNTLSTTSIIIATKFKTLWPLTPRKMLIKSHYWQNEDLSVEIAIEDAKKAEINENVEIDENAKNEKNEENTSKDEIVVDILSAHWKITPTNKETISVEYAFIVDAKGNIPYWLVNRMTLSSTWKTLNNLQQQLPTSKWQSQHLANITEVP